MYAVCMPNTTAIFSETQIIIHFVPLPPPPAYTARKPDLLEEIPIKVSLGTTLEATISAPLRTDRHPPIKMLEEQTTFLSRHLLPRFYGPETSGASAELPTQVHVVLAACSLSKHAHWMNSGHQLAEGLALGHRSQRYVVPPSENSKSDKFLCSLPFETSSCLTPAPWPPVSSASLRKQVKTLPENLQANS
ncbi:uncharacterized protein LOC115272047 isoform X5 [Suricata suricatta]|uniref:uncharacterized protein LOC115272047 isoform X5 n=1 Tax=Suricata suricatta TaxID=37032 RepID=UPI00115645E6|nr:uncharacterized protein LOC115272047 isoform X5 [Suricata suricatta]